VRQTYLKKSLSRLEKTLSKVLSSLKRKVVCGLSDIGMTDISRLLFFVITKEEAMECFRCPRSPLLLIFTTKGVNQLHDVFYNKNHKKLAYAVGYLSIYCSFKNNGFLSFRDRCTKWQPRKVQCALLVGIRL
jgi:hypothetical protein